MHPRLSVSSLSALLMAAGMFGYVFNDAMIKIVLDDLPVFQAIFLRGALALPMLVLLALRLGHLSQRMGRSDWLVTLGRAGLEALCTVWFMEAIRVLSLSNVTAILQAIPITVTMGAALFMGERVGWRRWLAIAVGLGGVLIILRPDSSGISVHAFYALLVVLAATARDLITRKLSSKAPSLQVAAITALVIFLLGASQYDSAVWVPVSGTNLLILSLAALAISATYLLMVLVMRIGSVSLAAPWRYTAIVWAVLLGFLLLGEWPDMATLFGAVIVVGAGLFTLWRERQSRAKGEKTG